MSSFTLNGLELVPDYIEKIPELTLSKGEIGNVVTIPQITIELNNGSNVFTRYKNSSIFHGRSTNDIRNMDLILTDNEETKWTGYPQGLPVLSNKRATLSGITELEKTLSNIKNTEYISDDMLTPAEVFSNILTLYGFGDKLHVTSINQSHTILNDGLLYINSNVLALNNIPLYDVIQQLAVLGCARVFVDSDGMIHYETFNTEDTYPTSVTLSEKHYNNLEITPKQIEPYDDYEIITKTGTCQLDTVNAKNVMSSIQAGDGEIFQITTMTGGFFLGDLYISQSNEETDEISIDIVDYVTDYIELGKNFTLENTFLGITGQKVEITEITYSNNFKNVSIKGLFRS